jgi:ERCC4-related helicase
MLTATPLSINPFQILNQINMIDQEMVPDPEELAMHYTCYENGKAVGYHNLEELNQRISLRYISFTRAELGLKGNYNLKLWLCKTPEEFEVPDNIDELKEVKSYPDNDAVYKIVELVKFYKSKGCRGLIYANLTLYKDMLRDTLKEFCNVEILDGRVDSKHKHLIQQKFNQGEYSVLISNLEEGQDLPCDYIIFYELSVRYKQFIGRGERGLSGRNLEIHFVMIDKSYEIEFFYRNIYKRSLLLELVCDKDVSEIKEIERQLKSGLSDASREDLELFNSYYLDKGEM